MDGNKNLSEEQLGEVAGSGPDPSKKCFFTPDKNTKAELRNGKYVIKCASSCLSCACHGKDWCVDRWHEIFQGSGNLSPESHANHRIKPKSNNYNT